MHLTTEEQQKKCISQSNAERVYLLFGNDAELLLSYRKKLCAMLSDICSEPDIMSGKSLDISALFDAAELVSFFGGRRLIIINDFEPEQLGSEDCKDLCAFISELSDNAVIVFCSPVDSFDIKKGKNAKKIFAAVDKAGVAVELNQREPESLKGLLRSRCKKRGCELSNEAAAFLIERCGSNMGTLLNECDKLCSYADRQPITIPMITMVCTGSLSADPFALSRLMLKGDTASVLSQIDSLIRMKQPVMLIASNISSAFCSIARACAAKAEGENADRFAKDFGFRFQWQAQNAFRDSARLTTAKAFEICEIFSDADIMMKSTPLDERILLETAVIRSMQVLGGRF